MFVNKRMAAEIKSLRESYGTAKRSAFDAGERTGRSTAQAIYNKTLSDLGITHQQAVARSVREVMLLEMG